MSCRIWVLALAVWAVGAAGSAAAAWPILLGGTADFTPGLGNDASPDTFTITNTSDADLNGGTTLTIAFDGFDSGETFVFTIDVDRTGGGGQNVNVQQFAGSGTTVAFTFDGPFVDSPLTSPPVTFDNIAGVAVAQFGGQADPAVVPEPGSWLIWSLCLFAPALAARCRLRAAPLLRQC